MELGRRARRLPSFSILNSGRPVHMLFHSLPSWATSRREPFVSPSSLAGWVINAASSFGTNDFFRSTFACSISSISQQKARFSHTRRDRNGHLATSGRFHRFRLQWFAKPTLDLESRSTPTAKRRQASTKGVASGNSHVVQNSLSITLLSLSPWGWGPAVQARTGRVSRMRNRSP